MEFASWQTTHPNVGGLFSAGLFAPSYANLGGEPSDVFVIFRIGPKLDAGAGPKLQNLANYGDGWSDMTPRAPAHY